MMQSIKRLLKSHKIRSRKLLGFIIGVVLAFMGLLKFEYVALYTAYAISNTMQKKSELNYLERGE